MRSTTGKTYKVVVWATGGVGRYAIRTAADRPNLELVGAWVHSAAKDGQDIGTLAGIEPLGVNATRDVDALLGGDADCVMYAAPAGPRPKEALADFCRILAAGKNIVTTSLPGLVYEKGSLSERYLEPIREAGTRWQQFDLLVRHRAGLRVRPVPDRPAVHVAPGVLGARHRDHQLLGVSGRVRRPRAVRIRPTAGLPGRPETPGGAEVGLGRRGHHGGRRLGRRTR